MKYINAEKLIERLEEMKRAEYENCGGVNSKTGVLQEVQELIDSLQQEQPDGLDEEVKKYWNAHAIDYRIGRVADLDFMLLCARHFAEWGAIHLNARNEE